MLCEAAQGVTHDSTAGISVDDIRAFTLNPDDGSEIELALPSFESCTTPTFAITLDGTFHFVIMSNDFDHAVIDPTNRKKKNKAYTWVEARNECRKKCMELVALDHPLKYDHLAQLLRGRVTTGVWTAGKRCLFDECAGIVEPVHLNGWYWATTYELLNPADEVEQGWSENPWGRFGILDMPQPDNAENFRNGSVTEACLAVKTAPMTQKAAWHDLPCNRKLGAVCEASSELSNYIIESAGLRPHN
ncbi:C-type lectin fold [Trinorchestia longiramus]|nr:C-type lectin fold [Trinorchestia longiramus]